MNIQIKTFYFNPLRECTYVVWDDTCQCVIIDPGCNGANEFSRLASFVESNGLKPVKVLLTHGHFDHVLALKETADKWNLEVCINKADIPWVRRAAGSCSIFGLEITPFTDTTTDVDDGDTVTFGNTTLQVIATPGHSRGGVCYFEPEEKVLFCGDTLFAGSIGRTDLGDGDYEVLMHSINTKLAPLPAGTAIYPGHGPSSTLSYELMTNPFLQG